MDEEKKVAIHMKIEEYYTKLHAGEFDDLTFLVHALAQLHDEVKNIAYPIEPQ